MRIAYVHDWLVVDGGAEKVARDIIDCFNVEDVDVFSLIDFLSDEDRATIIKGKKATTSFLQRLPFAQKTYRNFLELFPFAIEQFDLSKYDLVVSSSYAVAKGVLTAPHQVHICYCHSPMRYAWDLYHDYLNQHGLTSGLKAWYAKRVLHKMRIWDVASANRVDHYIANSENVARRINKYYGRQATVIYPPVDFEDFTLSVDPKEDYYFTTARLVPYKKTKLIVEAFNELPHLKLKIAGDGPEMKELQALAKSNIEFLGFIPRAKLIQHFQKTKAFIAAAKEDFGITCLEAQACGTPVVALKEGGYLETVLENKTGVFFNEQTIQSLKEGVQKFEADSVSFTPQEIREHTEKFSSNRFKIEFKSFVEQKLDRSL